MRARKLKFLKLLFWWTMVKLIKKPATAIDWLHQYFLGKLIIAMVQAEGG